MTGCCLFWKACTRDWVGIRLVAVVVKKIFKKRCIPKIAACHVGVGLSSFPIPLPTHSREYPWFGISPSFLSFAAMYHTCTSESSALWRAAGTPKKKIVRWQKKCNFLFQILQMKIWEDEQGMLSKLPPYSSCEMASVKFAIAMLQKQSLAATTSRHYY